MDTSSLGFDSAGVSTESGQAHLERGGAEAGLWAECEPPVRAAAAHHECFKIRDEARSKILDYIKLLYNRKRLHSTLGYRLDPSGLP
jgi:hypothetical protein